MPSVHLKVEELESRTLLTQYNLVILGPGYAWGINQNGDTVGQDNIHDPANRAAEWDVSGHETLFNAGPPSSANAINDNGQAVGRGARGSFGVYPIRCPTINCVEMPLLPGDSEGVAYAINESGWAVGYSGSGYPNYHAVLWQNG